MPLAFDKMRVYTRSMAHSCFCILLRQAARKTSAIYDQALAPLGMGVAQFSLLRKIERNGAISLTELAQLADLDRSTVGRNTKILQKQGWVELADSPDHRESLLRLTATGSALLQRGAPLWDQAQQEIELKLGQNGVEQLQSLLRAL